MKLLICFCLIVVGFNPDSITRKQKFETLLCKGWKISFFEKNGQSKSPEDEELDDSMTFYAENTVEIVKKGESQNAIWQYDATKKILTITDRTSKERAALKVIVLTKNEFVFESLDANHIRTHMKPQ